MTMDSSRKTEEVIAALLQNPTIKEAATVTGLHENTVLRLMKQPEFQDQYRQARQALLESTLSKLQELSSQAVATLSVVMAAQKSPASAKVSAARTVLEMQLRLIETADILQRLAVIEGKVMNNASN